MASHSVPLRALFEELHSSESGLSEEQAAARLARYGPNEIVALEKVRPLRIFFRQFRSALIAVLIVALALALALAEWLDAGAIGVILLLNAVLGFSQEYRAERTIEKLKEMAAPKARLLRAGRQTIVDARNVVPGDILLLEAGDIVAADGRLSYSVNLESQEAALTGESAPVSKAPATLPEDTAVAERQNMVFMGTTIVRGKGRALVTATGMATEFGKVAHLVQLKPEPSPLQLKLAGLARWITLVVIVLIAIIALAGLLRGLGFAMITMIALSLAVAAIPEGLPAVVTIGLAVGVRKMARRNVLVRRLPAVEALGSTTVICADKTGTLTTNEMTVRKLFVDGAVIDVAGEGWSLVGGFTQQGRPYKVDRARLLLTAGALCNDSALEEGKPRGDPTEVALIVAAAKAGIDKAALDKEHPRLEEIPFESERRLMSTVHELRGQHLMFTKGAPEAVLAICDRIALGGRVRKLTKARRAELMHTVQRFAADALRVLGFAYKPLAPGSRVRESGMIFLGLQAMADPPRAEAKEALARCASAGIRVIMITGDNELTARAIAAELGLTGLVMTGAELDKLSAEQLRAQVERIAVFARAEPRHKLKIIDALRANGHVVAMTGDGVNDAPALRRADLGIAMGIKGTEVAKEASAMVLTDDNFASIVNAVEEGRGIYDNIKKFFAYLFSGNIAELGIVFAAIISGLPLPLAPLQILLINLLTDGLPATALSVDPYEPDAMARKPRGLKEQIYHGLRPYLVYYPLIMFVICLTLFVLALKKVGPAMAMTVAFVTVSFFELFQAFSCRSTRQPALAVGLLRNKALVGAIALSAIVLLAVVYLVPLQKTFDTVALPLGWLALIIALSVSGAAAIELSKALRKA